jgi:hypothetical protein
MDCRCGGSRPPTTRNGASGAASISRSPKRPGRPRRIAMCVSELPTVGSQQTMSSETRARGRTRVSAWGRLHRRSLQAGDRRTHMPHACAGVFCRTTRPRCSSLLARVAAGPSDAEFAAKSVRPRHCRPFTRAHRGASADWRRRSERSRRTTARFAIWSLVLPYWLTCGAVVDHLVPSNGGFPRID